MVLYKRINRGTYLPVFDKLKITDAEEMNLKSTHGMFKTVEKKYSQTISPKVVDEIRDVIREYDDIFEISEVCSPDVMDGGYLDLEFSVDGQKAKFSLYCPWAIEDNTKVEEEKNVLRLVELSNRIEAILVKAGVSSHLLYLNDWDEDFD